MSAALIECRALSRAFDLGGQQFHALREVDLQITRGELVAVVGASGSGKSSLLNLIGGLDVPSRGEVLFEGRCLGSLAEPELARLRNQRVGFVFQHFNLLARASALKNVELPLVYAGQPVPARRARALALLTQLGLAEHAAKRPAQMSGGQQQRVAIARALALQPALLLADEPTGALDSVTSREVMDLLTALNREQGITVVIVSHDEAIAARCNRVVRFSDGRVIADEVKA